MDVYSQKTFKGRLALILSVLPLFLSGTNAQDSPPAPSSVGNSTNTTDIMKTIENNMPDAINDLLGTASDETAAYLNAHQWIVSIAMIVVGILYLFFGWKLYKIIIWLNGFVFGFALFQILTLTIIASANPTMDPNTSQWIGFGVGIVGGIIGGTLALFLKVLGVALIGALFGWVVGYNLDLVIQKLCNDTGATSSTNPYPNWASWIVYISMAVVFGLMTACFQKPLVITFTAGIGSFLTLAAIGSLTGTWPKAFDGTETINWTDYTVWGWVGGMVVLWIIGIAIQCKIFGNIEHNDTHDKVPQKASV